MAIFGTGVDINDLNRIDNMTGAAATVGFFENTDDEGQGLTFVGSTLYLASGKGSDAQLYTLNTTATTDPPLGDATKVADLNFSAFSTLDIVPLDDPRIASMATAPDGTICGLLKSGSRRDDGGPLTYLVTINRVTGAVTPVGFGQPTPVNLDGLAFILDGLLTCTQPG